MRQSTRQRRKKKVAKKEEKERMSHDGVDARHGVRQHLHL